MKEALHQQTIQEDLQRYGDLPVRLDRKSLVLGSDGERNIGHSIAQRLHAHDHQVTAPSALEVDVRHARDLQDAYRANADTLVVSTGYTDLAWIEDQDENEIVQMLDVNLFGPILALKEFVNATMDDPWLKYVVFIGSMAYRNVLNASAYYCAAKAGLAHFVRCAGWELTPKGYRIFCVHPSNVEGTPMTDATIQGIARYRNLSDEDAEAYWSSINLMPRWLRPEDVAREVVHLVSGRADYLSGANVEMPGGQR